MLRGLRVFVSGMALAAFTLAGAGVASAQEPAAPAKPVLTLDGDAAVVTFLIKPDKTADFESVMAKLKEALGKSDKAERKAAARRPEVLQVAHSRCNDSAVYILMVDPVVKDEEYDITRLITEVFPVEVQEVFLKYKDSFAGRAITILNKVP